MKIFSCKMVQHKQVLHDENLNNNNFIFIQFGHFNVFTLMLIYVILQFFIHISLHLIYFNVQIWDRH